MSTTVTNIPIYPDLAGKGVWVTGSSRGIGAEIARRFAEQGAKVAVYGRDSAAVSAVRGEIERSRLRPCAFWHT